MAARGYPASRYEPSPLVDLVSPDARQRLSPAALKAFFNIMEHWHVRDEDARALLGGISNGPFYAMKKQPAERVLDADTLLRVSYLIGIFKALNILHGRALADEWVHAAEHEPHLRRSHAARLHAQGRRHQHANGATAARRATRRDVSGLPHRSLVRRNDTHRLIPSQHRDDGQTVLTRLTDDDAELAHLYDLDNATNDRLLAENDLLPGIRVHELLFGVPYYRIVNASFTHAHPLGSRFNGPDRGAWYAAFEIRTAQAEIAFHKTLHLEEIGRYEDDVTFDDYLADVSGELHDLRGDTDFATCLDPRSYVASQTLAGRLMDVGSLGVIYPSVRRAGGTCLACFRPSLVMNVRRAKTYRFRWSGRAVPVVTVDVRGARG